MDSNNVFDMIDRARSKIICLQLDIILLPITSLQQREQLYVRKREQRVPFLEYKYPLIQNTCVDVIVNGKNVQEKVLGYDELENEYYWLHSSIDNRFWIIPELILYNKGYLSKKDETMPKKMLWFKSENNINKEWLVEYEYNYDIIDKEAILKCFE